jgi:methyl halide transferase
MRDRNYWNETYKNNKTGWDVGYAATPLKSYFDQLSDKTIKILVPGAGNAYEVEYLFKSGFKNVYLLDFAETPIHSFLIRNPGFPKQQLLIEDFFEHKGSYDLIIEHTFLTSFPKDMRANYASKMHQLLNKNGKLVGLAFNHEFGKDFPPFGGTPKEYINLFSPYFDIQTLELSYNSIKPRVGREHFFILTKK